ncbi:MAG: hypothetical protein ACC650_08220 [Gammaproteobacteria bacterium]
MIKLNTLPKISLLVVWLTLLLGSNASVASFFNKWPEMPVPPQSKVAWVAEDIIQNGVPMKIQNFSSKLDTKSITDFYVSTWSKSSGPKPVVNKSAEWTIIGRIDGGYLLTVQTKKSKNGLGSEGFLAVSTLLASLKSGSIGPDTSFPRLSGTKILSDTLSKDLGRTGKTLILKNNYSVRSNTSFYLNKMKAKGWIIDPFSKESQRSAVNSTYLYFNRNNESLTITITRLSSEMGSSIVVNITNISV